MTLETFTDRVEARCSKHKGPRASRPAGPPPVRREPEAELVAIALPVPGSREPEDAVRGLIEGLLDRRKKKQR